MFHQELNTMTITGHKKKCSHAGFFPIIDQKKRITEAVSVAQELCFVIALRDQKFALLSAYLASSSAVYLIEGMICDFN